MQANAIHHLVDEVATADCVTKLKPDPEGLEMLAARFECEPSQMVVIGDHVHDMTGAKKFGATAVRARWCGLVPDDCLLADHQFLDVGGFEKWVHSQF
jgi:phosphoglycolate phosphatase-like HAD superfamily hydrolase